MAHSVVVCLPQDAAKTEVTEIEVDAVDTVYSLKEKIIAEMRSEDLRCKDLVIYCGGRRLVDRDIVSGLPKTKVDVVASKKAVTVEMRSDNDPTFKWDVIMGIDCPLKVITDKHVVQHKKGLTRLVVSSDTTPRALKSRSNSVQLLLTP